MALCLGANLGDPRLELARAASALRPRLEPCRASSLYLTRPLSPIAQSDYLNAALVGTTDLDPRQLLALGQELEHQAGRRPGARWGPRPLDIDIAWHDGPHTNDDRLVLPHPRLRQRLFALAPLAELEPQRRLPPDSRTVAELEADLRRQGEQIVERLAGPEWTGW